jgi:hypothetical protein
VGLRRLRRCEISAPTHPSPPTLARVSLLLSPPSGDCMNEAAMRSAVQPLGWAISNELRLGYAGQDGVLHRSPHIRVHPRIYHIMSIQDEGPYLLGGYCNGGYVAYEIARRLASRGHRVDLLASVESPVIGHDDRLFRITRRLLFSVKRPTELLGYLTRKLGKITFSRVHDYLIPDHVNHPREFDRIGLQRAVHFSRGSRIPRAIS